MFNRLKSGMFVLGMALVLPTMGWAQVNFSQKPLSAGGGVDPNLMFVFDDSGSMRWGYMPDSLLFEASLAAEPTASSTGCDIYTNWAGQRIARCAIEDNRFLASSHLNKVYYDPDVTYVRPLGADGELMPNSDFSDALLNGFDPSSTKIDLSDSFRALMDDYSRFGEGFAVSENRQTEPAFYFEFSGTTACNDNPYPDSCYTKVVVGSAEEQNFANWFSYYRTREMAAKAGIGAVFGDRDLSDDFRLGYGRINKAQGTVDGVDIRAVVSGVRPFKASRTPFLEWLYGIDSSGGTPLRRALDGAGRYFENSDRPWLDDPSNSNNDGSNPARECRISATMLMTDGFYSNNGPSGFGNADNTPGSEITNGVGDTGKYEAVAPFSDNESNTLADIANYYWKRDLVSDVDNYVPTIDAVVGSNNDGIRQTVGNPAFWQHMMTYGIGFGVEGSVSRDDAVDAAIKGTSIDWWTGTAGENKINDLLHASINGRGDFFSAGDPAIFRSELSGLLDQFLGNAGSATGLDFNVASIEAADSALSFSSFFDPAGWSGDLKATTLAADASGRPDLSVPDTNGWSARAQLEGIDDNMRTVLTYDNGSGVPFRLSSLSNSSPLRADLEVGDASLAPLRVDYLRGKRKATIEAENSGQGQFFRDRSALLGTIVNSTPRFVGVPDSSWPNDDNFGDGQYNVFRNDNLDRTSAVYVGSNDGMLHGFRVEDEVDNNGVVTAVGGDEVLAYIPSFIASTSQGEGLHHLTQPGYDHRFYVDLNLEVVDVFSKGRTSRGQGIDNTRAWRTVLIGGSRAGARGIFALDVTNPDDFSETDAAESVLWEFTHQDLGYLVEPPEIAQMIWPDDSIRWTVFVPSGYNNDNDTTGFFMLDLEGGLDGTWTEWFGGSGDYIYHEFESSGTGLSPVTVVDSANDDFLVDRVYAGDLDGNLWVASNDNDNNNMTTAHSSSGTDSPYFKAPQSITSAPAVSLGLADGKDPNIMIMFGTGKYLEDGDIGDTSAQYFYSVLETSDSGTLPVTPDKLEPAPVNSQAGGTIDGVSREIRVENESNNRVDYDNKLGWYTELPESGERIVNFPIVRGDFVFVNTLIPGANPCLGGGDGFVMGFDILRAQNVTPSYAAFGNSTEGAVGFRVGGAPSQLATWDSFLTFGTGDGGGDFIELPEIVIGLGRKGWREMTQ